jgi:hypothetical protein
MTNRFKGFLETQNIKGFSLRKSNPYTIENERKINKRTGN